ncbi:4Fe-4S binding protein [Alterileibacterium massiliense]|uniref:4Fe-4S binding protein n=1 Tax=Alterileibacterium massiliense TaxID=1870997 RepID=UPI0008D97E93|nr:4Fe-4S binding protein [Alterileibacterium massiliense]
MAYKIEENCISCGACADGCPVDCITEGAPYSIDENACIDCGNCASVCPVGAPVEA